MPDRLLKQMDDQDRSFVHAKLELREEKDAPLRIEIFIPYDVVTDVFWFNEVIRPGFFSRAVSEKQDVVMWYQHGEGGQLPLGRVAAGTLELEDTARGLRAIATPPDRPWVEDLVVSIRREEVNGASFAFAPVEINWVEKEGQPDLRELIDGDIWDVSPVVFPAYPKTLTAVRQAAERVYRRWIEKRAASAPAGATKNNDGERDIVVPEPAVRIDEVSLRRYYCDGEYLAALYGIPKVPGGN